MTKPVPTLNLPPEFAVLDEHVARWKEPDPPRAGTDRPTVTEPSGASGAATRGNRNASGGVRTSPLAARLWLRFQSLLLLALDLARDVCETLWCTMWGV